MVEVNKEDLAVIRELEKITGKKIRRIENRELKLDEVSYRLDEEGRIVELALFQCGIKDMSPICQLKNLMILKLYRNQLTSVPEGIGKLKNLMDLWLSCNQLTSLPEGIRGLKNLRALWLSDEQLTSVPEEIRELKNLQTLDLSDNQLTNVPEWIGELKNLRTLYLENNQLTSMPEWIRELKNLTTLYLSNNQLASVPEWIGQLTELGTRGLESNPIKEPPIEIVKKGIKAIREYFLEKAKGARKRYEGKLLILGDGGEGKTCVSRVLQGLPFCPQVTTRGVDIVPWKFVNPKEEGTNITLNIWDFEGQEINHQTHQFFLTTQSLYILVFKCREIFRIDRAEYWLDTIKARAAKSKVLLVITECEERMPFISLDKLKAEYADLFEGDITDWYFPIGCANGKGADDLRRKVQQYASEMELMGIEWPNTYQNAEEEIKKQREGSTHISRKKLYSIFKAKNISKDNYENAADLMAKIGVITQFEGRPDLKDFVVLQPPWLTKAISWILEDEQLAKEQGEISHLRMQTIWENKGLHGLYSIFHSCMKEFELCYDMEDLRGCLVPLRFGAIAPEIPWSVTEPFKARRVEYKLNIRPPFGLMSRFIVKTHPLIVKTELMPNGVYWHNGVFLATGEGTMRSEALCVFDPDEKILSIEVRAAFPQNMLEQLHWVVKSVFSFYQGIIPERKYGCVKFVDDQKEEQCKGVHSEERIIYALTRKKTLDCEKGWHEVDPTRLKYGFCTFGQMLTEETLRRVLREQTKPILDDAMSILVMVDKLYGETIGLKKLSAETKQMIDSHTRNYLRSMDQMLDDRDFTSAPGIIGIRAKDGSAFNPRRWFETEYVFTPYCECIGQVHPCEDGNITFRMRKEWWAKASPWVGRAVNLLGAGIKLSCVGMPLVPGTVGEIAGAVSEAMRKEMDFMKELADYLKLEGSASSAFDQFSEFSREDGRMARAFSEDVREGIDLRGDANCVTRMQLAELLEEIAGAKYKAKQWGSLRRVRMPDDSYRWLCPEHAEMVKR